MENNLKTIKSASSMTINFEEGFTVQGVTSVIENNEAAFVASVGGVILTVSGTKFSLDSFNIEEKIAKVSGKISSLKLAKTREKVSALKRLFK